MKKYKNYIIAILIIISAMVTICFVPISVSKLIPVIEEQAAKDYGLDIHIEKLILRVGPVIKIKAPVMHVMYTDGQKFAHFDNVRFYIPWSSLIKRKPAVKYMRANALKIAVNSDDKYLPDLITGLKSKEFSQLPDFDVKKYKFTYNDKISDNLYTLTGQDVSIRKLLTHKNFKMSGKGFFEINDKQYINYDVSVLPQFDMQDKTADFDIINIVNQIKTLDFHSDIVADIKLYKNNEGYMQASGFLNIDNISVLDTGRKIPKSFIYLTLWGDKASVLSNIYTNATKKVYLEGMINNSKKTMLDLKVKTDEINLQDLYNKLKIFTDFSRIRDIQSIDGTLNANFTVKGDLNKIKSSGYLKISNAGINSNGLKINRINSDIDFSDNIINITNAVGYVNNAPILLKGKIDKNVNLELLMDKVELKYLLPAEFGVKSGIASLVSNISGTADKIIHNENLLIENFSVEKNGNFITVTSAKIDTNKNNTAYINNINIKTKPVENLKIPSLRLLITPENIQVPETNIFMPNSKMVLKSVISNYNDKNNEITFNVNLEGFVNSSDIKTSTIKNVRYPIKLLIYGNNSTQNANAQVLLENSAIFDEPSIVNLETKINKGIVKIEDLSASSFSGKFTGDFKNNLKGQKKLVVTGNVENLKAPVLKNLRITTPQILNLSVADSMAQLRADLFVNGEISKPELIGQVVVQNFVNQATKTAVSNCTVDFNKTIATINAPLVKIGDSSMGINANVFTDFSKRLLVKNLNIKSKYINTDTFLMYKDILSAKLIPIEVTDGKFFSERVVANIYNSPVYMTAFSGDIKLNNNNLTLNNIASEIFNGKISGNLNFNMKDDTFRTKLMARGVSAEPIFNIISTRKDSISGVVDFDTDVQGNLLSKKSLNGTVRFIVHNGRMSTLGKVEHLLYAQNVVADSMLRTSFSVIAKALTLKDTGLFKYLRGDVVLTNGIANIKLLQSQGPLMSLFIKGQYSPDTDYANLVVLGRLSDEVVTGLGAFGEFSFKKLMVMLTGNEDKFNIKAEDIEKLPPLPMKNTKEFRSIINGTVDKPSSVLQFNWISYTEKSLRQKDVPTSNIKVPNFIEGLPY